MIGSLARFQLDPRSPAGIAAQIRTRVGLLVADGELRPGDRLPPVRDLAAHLGVGVNTVRAAYARLEADGLVRTRHGVGTTVLAVTPGTLATPHPLGTNTIAVLIAGLNPFYLPLLQGIEAVAAEHGTLVLVADTHDSEGEAETVIRRLVARGIDGIIAVSVGGAPARSRSTTPHHAALPPIVHVDQPDRTGHVLLFDGRGAGSAATRHLRAHGHHRIGMVTGPLAWRNVREVHAGYLAALQATGAARDPDLVAEVEGFSVEAGRRGLAQLLDRPNPPTAVFAAGEPLAVGALQETRARGIDVPNGLALAGYNDSVLAALVEPALTMVSVPGVEMGTRAMGLLAGLLQGKRTPSRRTVLPTDLEVRASCGPHPTSGHDPAAAA